MRYFEFLNYVHHKYYVHCDPWILYFFVQFPDWIPKLSWSTRPLKQAQAPQAKSKTTTTTINTKSKRKVPTFPVPIFTIWAVWINSPQEALCSKWCICLSSTGFLSGKTTIFWLFGGTTKKGCQETGRGHSIETSHVSRSPQTRCASHSAAPGSFFQMSFS